MGCPSDENKQGRMVLQLIFGRVAFVVTASIHLYFNDLIKATATATAMCLSDSKRPIIQSIFRLHSVVMACFVLGFCFNSVSAHPEQVKLGTGRDIIHVSGG